MINSTIKYVEVLLKPLTFPLLAQSINQNEPDTVFTVLFTSPSEGTVVHVGPKAGWRIGDRHGNFVACDCREHWEILPPSECVVLKNS